MFRKALLALAAVGAIGLGVGMSSTAEAGHGCGYYGGHHHHHHYRHHHGHYRGHYGYRGYGYGGPSIYRSYYGPGYGSYYRGGYGGYGYGYPRSGVGLYIGF
jgi:hypothetical protein